MVSIIITTRNSENFIADCINAVKNSNYKDTEIILVDNNSTDRTVEIAKELGAKTFIKGPERSAQRNYGAEMSSGEIIGFLDVDMTLSENVITECLEVFNSNKNIQALYIPEKIYGSSFFNRVRSFERSFYDATVIDAVRFFRKEAFIKIGGFDSNLNGTEDWDIDRRIKQIGDVDIIKSPLYHHENHTLKQYIVKKSYYASNFNNYFDKWGYDEITKKQFGLFYRYIGVYIEKGKWKKLLFHPIYTISMYFLRFLIGIVYILSKFNISKKENVYRDKND